ncbi:uncharacterized protein LOC142574237 [Dermacentor variabilis]|uniref:uncharacterized protein LOC142574237 n=1 Tax=Dermacentor variabilis TaxID=34621 RepID=UPI003F5C3C94
MRLILALVVLVVATVTTTSALPPPLPPPLPPLIPPLFGGLNDLLKPIPHCIKIFFLPNRFCWSWENDLSELCSSNNVSDTGSSPSDENPAASASPTDNAKTTQDGGTTSLGSGGQNRLSRL